MPTAVPIGIPPQQRHREEPCQAWQHPGPSQQVRQAGLPGRVFDEQIEQSDAGSEREHGSRDRAGPSLAGLEGPYRPEPGDDAERSDDGQVDEVGRDGGVYARLAVCGIAGPDVVGQFVGGGMVDVHDDQGDDGKRKAYVHRPDGQSLTLAKWPGVPRRRLYEWKQLGLHDRASEWTWVHG